MKPPVKTSKLVGPLRQIEAFVKPSVKTSMLSGPSVKLRVLMKPPVKTTEPLGPLLPHYASGGACTLGRNRESNTNSDHFEVT